VCSSTGDGARNRGAFDTADRAPRSSGQERFGHRGPHPREGSSAAAAAGADGRSSGATATSRAPTSGSSGCGRCAVRFFLTGDAGIGKSCLMVESALLL
jgi:hypothetical protein